MFSTSIFESERAEANAARAKVARKWARLTQLFLIGAMGVAIWQDPTLAPRINDQMQNAYAFGLDFLEDSESGSGFLASFAGFDGQGNQSEHNFLTSFLLNARQ